ncbi:MAG: hypothetical protein KBC66_10315 [Kiritimatiellae bacterium]|nr:hypothetical protein [Kiritimatiellia bacterium]NLD89632.1 hypothetical protein [Lentisphaerota bacterium]HPC19158.1 hypothetical protein [Kiritimatiellia bacterium]HQN80576.1 hypothetical protein [Kiritimatiellia bacterium]HQQ60940.1 hypothetical protein [Kiritimatiellia bacterium]
MKRNWTRWAGLLVLGMLCAAAEADYFTYWTQLQAVNLTPYDIQITKTQWKYLDDDKPHVKAGDILPKADPNNPQQEPIQIGEVSRWSGGVDIEIWFKLLGNVGSQDCYLKIHNPYTGKNTITPGKTFPTAQCPSVAPPEIPDSQPAPLYHNIDLPSSGHKLALVALFSFQDLIPDEGVPMSSSQQQQAAQESKQQIHQAEQDRNKFRQETGIYVP